MADLTVSFVDVGVKDFADVEEWQVLPLRAEAVQTLRALAHGYRERKQRKIEADVAQQENSRRSKREHQALEARHHELCDRAEGDQGEQRGHDEPGPPDESRSRLEGMFAIDGSRFGAISSTIARKAHQQGAFRELSSNRPERGVDGVITVDSVSKRCGRVQGTPRVMAKFSSRVPRGGASAARNTLAAGACRVAWEFFSTEIRMRAEKEAYALNRML